MKIAETTVLLVFLLVCATGCYGAPSIQDNKQGALTINLQVQAEERVLTNLESALASSGKVARIYFRGACNKDDSGELLLPVMNIQIPAKAGSGLEAVREMFRDVSDVVVSEDRSGIVTIKIGDVSGAILDTKLPLLIFDQGAQYNPYGPGSAIAAIEKANEFKVALARLKVAKASVFYIIPQQPVLNTLPHLPPSIKNTTVDQALDSIAKTFQGVVTYGECKNSNGGSLIDIEFYWLHSGDSNSN